MYTPVCPTREIRDEGGSSHPLERPRQYRNTKQDVIGAVVENACAINALHGDSVILMTRSAVRSPIAPQGPIRFSLRPFATVGSRLILGCLGVCVPALAADALSQPVALDIAANTPLDEALIQWGTQAHVQIMMDTSETERERTPAVHGTFRAADALSVLLQDSGLSWKVSDETVTVAARSVRSPEKEKPLRTADAQPASPPDETVKPASTDAHPAGKESTADESHPDTTSTAHGIPEVLVRGSKMLNTDIQRTPDDAQPYVVFDRRTIETSGANSIEELLKNRLPMNSQSGTNSQRSVFGAGNVSQFNLRGLGTNQTLILVDGRRLAATVNLSSGLPIQSDLNGIPLFAIERIEVLPTTASGIYGGSATGGVINIILRRDYSGADLQLTYANSFRADAPSGRVDLGGGFNLEGGRTNVLFAAGYSDTGSLPLGDRDFAQQGRQVILQNNPASLTGPLTPPLGATTNIRSVSGAPLFGPGTSFYTSVPVGYAGGGGLAPLQQNAGSYNLNLPDTAQYPGAQMSLLSGVRIASGSATIRRQFTPYLQAFLDMGVTGTSTYARHSFLSGSYLLPASAPNNPFGQSVEVTTPLSVGDSDVTVAQADHRVVGGLILQLPRGWTTEADYTWSQSRFSSSGPGLDLQFSGGTAISSGAADVLRDTAAFPLNLAAFPVSEIAWLPRHSTLKDASLRFSGPLFSLPAGALTLSALVEHRDELFDQAIEVFPPTPNIVYPARSQTVDSVYSEIQLPIVSPTNALPMLQELQLQLAGRYDRYTIHGATNNATVATLSSVLEANETLSSTNPTLALRYRPILDVMLRGSWGTGFLPPAVNQLTPNLPSTTTPIGLVDPRRGNAPIGTLALTSGGSPNLRPEDSSSWSAGLVLTPHLAPGLRASVDWTRITKTNNIYQPTVNQAFLSSEADLPGRIIRGPVSPNDPYGVGPIVGVNASLVNIARAVVEAYDFSLDYKWDAGRPGALAIWAIGSYQTHYQTQLLPTLPVVENVGIGTANPLKLRVNFGLSWSHGGWMLAWTSRYYDSYLVADPTQVVNATAIKTQGNGGKVSSQLYHDLLVSYQTDSSSGMLANLEVQLGATNIFDKAPPVDTSTFNSYSPFADPRLAAFYASVRKKF